MFVRWKKRVSTAGWQYHKDEKDYTISAYLVESVRINEKPKHKVLSFLGSLKSDEMRKHEKQISWWVHVERKINALTIRLSTKSRWRHTGVTKTQAYITTGRYFLQARDLDVIFGRPVNGPRSDELVTSALCLKRSTLVTRRR